jgi:hypothetical protein
MESVQLIGIGGWAGQIEKVLLIELLCCTVAQQFPTLEPAGMTNTAGSLGREGEPSFMIG